MNSLFVFLLFLLNSEIFAEKFDYHWKDYFEEIPSNALPGGLDKSHDATYIAQLFVQNKGILPTRLYEGQKSVTVSKEGLHTSDVFIKVLCSDTPWKFTWKPAKAETLHIDFIGKHLVVGGTEDEKILNIGRVAYQGEVIVGKVCGYSMGNSKLYFPYKNEEVDVTSYEVLVYDPEAELIINETASPITN